MEYVYSVLLLHALGKDITEKKVADIIKAAGGTPDTARIKALISSLEDINIDEAIKTSAFVAPVQAPVESGSKPEKAEAKKEEKKKEEKKEEEEAMAGLGALFG